MLMTLDVSHPTLDLAGAVSESLKGKKIVLPLCGGNIDLNTLDRVIERVRFHLVPPVGRP